MPLRDTKTHVRKALEVKGKQVALLRPLQPFQCFQTFNLAALNCHLQGIWLH